MSTAMLLTLFIVLIYMTVFFFLSLSFRKMSIADIAWGLGFILISGVTLQLSTYLGIKQLIVFILVFLWGTRLAIHIYLRNEHISEDFRYMAWKKKWGRYWIVKSYIYVFLLQGLFMILVSLPIIYTNTQTVGTLGIFDRVGLLIWIVGFYFEAVSDYQLSKFKKKAINKGKILQEGLWKYSRHPNYFGESLMWWGIYFIALSNISAWWTIISPIFITFSLLRVSGVPLLERKYQRNKEYHLYIKKTSAFIPWFTKFEK